MQETLIGLASAEGVLSLVENDGPIPLPDEGDLRASLHNHERTFAAALAARLVELQVRRERGEPRVCLLPGGNCGFVSLATPSPLSLHVRPKIPGANWLGLAALAGELGSLRWQDAPPALGMTDAPTMPELLLVAFARAAAAFLRIGPRRLHGARREVLRGKVRGRPLVPALVREVAAGRFDRVPCEFAAHGLDNPPNRVLREASHRLRLVAHALPFASRLHAERETLDRLDSHLADASAFSTADLRQASRLPGHFAHYRDLIGLASLVLHRLSLADRPGTTPSVSLSLSMPLVFERAFQREARRADPGVLVSPEWPLLIGKEWSGTMIPDLYAPATPDRAALVLDLKWKTALERSETNNPDLYQATAYALAAQARQPGVDAVAVLVYPSSSEGLPVRVRPPEGAVRLYLAPWHVRGDCAASFRTLWAEITRLLAPG